MPSRPLLLICLLAAGCLLGGCYRPPSALDYSLLPTTNNPELTRDRCTLFPSGDF